MSMPHETAVLNPELNQTLADLYTLVQQAAQAGTAVHEVERALWGRVLRIGRHALQLFFTLHGSGDQGDTVHLPDGRSLDRLPELHTRRYVSIFGNFVLQRTAYGSREGQKIEFVPLDNRLQLPASAFSYVLQDWDQALCAEEAFGQVNSTIARMLGLKQSVDSLEHMNQDLAEHATPFRLNRPLPPAAEEGDVFVVSADGKGVVLRRGPDDPAPPAYRTRGDKASQKRMATVRTVYSAGRHVRTPEQVVAALFRDGPRPEGDRPQPRHKQVWANLPQADRPVSGIEAVFLWLLWEVSRRNPGRAKEVVYLSDGQESLWAAQEQYLGGRGTVGILDLLHVTPRLWKAAHVFHAEKSAAAEAFVRERLLRVSQGQVARVIHGLRVLGGRRALPAAKRKALREVCNYLEKNQGRMRYDEYLAAGYPIASGVIEGACRHVVKDRMERAGMHWTIPGAQAMLEVRSVYASGQWEEYQASVSHRRRNGSIPTGRWRSPSMLWPCSGRPVTPN
jgi:hypothetical protein